MPIEPALGFSGALSSLQQQQPMSSSYPQGGGGGGGGGDMSTAAGDLSRAARGLESVQGNISGQTMAISQMAQQQQQQVTNLSVLLNQFGTQLQGLMQAVHGLSTSTHMQSGRMALSAPMAAPAFNMAPAMSAGAYRPDIGAMAMSGGAVGAQGVMLAGAGLMNFGRGFGGLGGAMVSPFFGEHIGLPGPGQLAPSIGNAGLMRSMAMASGLSIGARDMRSSSGVAIQEAARERTANLGGDAFMGVLGGGAHLGATLGADVAGTMFTRGALGMAGIGGGIAGSILGLPLAAAGGVAIDQVMKQAGAIRGFGDQYAKGAHRFMPTGGMGFQNIRRPSMSQRNQVGEALNSASIEDLTFSRKDMQEIFGGAMESDMFRGVQSTEEVVRRFRTLKDTTKTMARTLRTLPSEAMGLQGEMQAMGMDVAVDPMRGRRAIFGASSVQGMTPQEALRHSMSFGRRFVSQGLGSEAEGVGSLSAAVGQGTIQQGLLSAADIAAVGGREGVSDVMGNAVMNFMNSSQGQTTLIAGNRDGRFNISDVRGLGAADVMRQASSRATKSNLTDLALGNEKRMREAMADPTDLLVNVILPQAMSQAEMWESQGMDKGEAFRLALSQKSGMRGPELEVLMQNVMGLDKSLGDRAQGMVRQLSSNITDSAIEERSIFARMGRDVERFFQPAGEVVASGARATGDWLSNQAGEAGDALRGLTNVTTRSDDLDFGSLSELTKGDDALASRLDETNTELAGVDKELTMLRTRATGARESRNDARIRFLEDKKKDLTRTRGQLELRDPSVKISEGLSAAARRVVDKVVANAPADFNKIVKKIKDTKDPDVRRDLIEKLLNKATEDAWSGAEPKWKRALQDAVMNKFHLSASELERGHAPGSGGDAGAAHAALSRIASDLGLSHDDARDTARDDGLIEYVKAAASGGDISELQEKLKGGKLTAREFQRINELSDDDKRRLVNDVEIFGDLNKKMHNDLAVSSMGKAVGSKLEDLKIVPSSYTGALRSGDTRSVVDALGKMTLSPEKMAELKKGDSRMASVFENIKEGAVGEQQEKIIRDLVGDTFYDDSVGPDGIITGDNVGRIRAKALAGRGLGDGKVKVGAEGIATDQAKEMYDVTRYTVDLSNNVKEITRMLVELKGRS